MLTLRNNVQQTKGKMMDSIVNAPRRPRSIEEALSECEREMAVRCHVYDRWITEGRLNRVDAADRLDRMASAIIHLNDYNHAQANEKP